MVLLILNFYYSKILKYILFNGIGVAWTFCHNAVSIYIIIESAA